MFERLHPIAVAVAESFASRARHEAGVVLGTRFPFHEKPLVSATAQLALALLALGSHVEVVAGAAGFVAGTRQRDGSFGDAGAESDVMTTWVAAELLSVTDPGFELAPTLEWLAARQQSSGFFRALGPEQPWLTLQVVELLRSAQRSFAERFRFPHVQTVNLDRKTQLPFFAYFVELGELFGTLPGTREVELEVGFLDLIGFREFNNRYGQALGDEVLAEFAAALSESSTLRAIRDGGDEFLLVGAPTHRGVFEQIARIQQAWPARFRARFGADAPAVLSRALVATCSGSGLLACREALGRGIGALKHAAIDAKLGLLQRL
jgi:GGDEF domain-containing protein